MTVKRGLGRGLDALLGDAPVPVARANDAPQAIPVARITPNPFQPRKTFANEALGELKASIAQHGVLVPIIVRRRGDDYELIAGERRWRACAALGRTTIPAIVRSSDDRETLEIAIVENLQREDLNPIEEAAGLAQLIEEHGFTQEAVAQRLGKNRATVSNALRLLALPDPIKALVVERRLTAGHARALLAAPENLRATLAQRVVEEGLSVRALERLTADDAPSRARPNASDAMSPDGHGARGERGLSAEEREFESRLRERLATHVTLLRSGTGGRIEVRFSDEDELMRIGDLLLGEV